MTAETLIWHPCTESLPDADTTVLIALDETHEKPTAVGYFTGSGWTDTHHRDVYGVLAWADMPRGVRRG